MATSFRGGLYFGFGVPPAVPRQVVNILTVPFRTHTTCIRCGYSDRSDPVPRKPSDVKNQRRPDVSPERGIFGDKGRAPLATAPASRLSETFPAPPHLTAVSPASATPNGTMEQRRPVQTARVSPDLGSRPARGLNPTSFETSLGETAPTTARPPLL